PLRHLAQWIGGPLPRGNGTGRTAADPRERDPSWALSYDREHDVVAAPDAEATPQILCRRLEYAGLFRLRRREGLFGDGDPAGWRHNAAIAQCLSQRLEGGRSSGRGRDHAGVSYVLQY